MRILKEERINRKETKIGKKIQKKMEDKENGGQRKWRTKKANQNWEQLEPNGAKSGLQLAGKNLSKQEKEK